MSHDATPRAHALAGVHKAHAGLAGRTIAELFAFEPARFERFSARLDDLLLDFSKTGIDKHALDALLTLAQACDVPAARERMFAGEKINNTEGRAVLHTALRRTDGAAVCVDGRDVMPEVKAERAKCLAFANGVRGGRIAAADGHPFTDVVNIGIGGSDLGAAMAVPALAPYAAGPRVHFVSNVDGAHLFDVLKTLDPARTLFIVASKTFTTVETMTNARSARQWVVAALGEAAVGHHFAAVSTALDKVAAFGIASDRVFGIWDWVGGRYSIWSAIGLPLMIAIGEAHFTAFLAGAESLDTHFRTAPLARNLPVLLALVGLWHRLGCGFSSRAVIPYDQRLARFPAYLQQLDMESNGKGVKADGTKVDGATGPIVWGEAGTNGQHAFFQLLHQGTDIIPVEFILAAKPHEGEPQGHHSLLIANCLAQSQALMQGRTLEAAGGNPHRVFTGNRPSITLLHERLTPFALGRLIALYEHRVFVESVIFGINAFDQWGVELGKELATKLAPALEHGEGLCALDGSTAGLIAAVRGAGR